MGVFAVDLLLAGKSDAIVAEIDGEIVSSDIRFALTTDKMYKNKLKEGQLDGFSDEDIDRMKAICAKRSADIQRLYQISLGLCR